MAFRVFQIPVGNAEPFEAALNTFLSTHRVLKVERRFVDAGEHSFWAFCVDFQPGPASSGGASRGDGSGNSSGKSKIDYKAILQPDEFKLFSRLRELRKELAAVESIPVYIVFTNEQLAQVVQQSVTTREELEKIEGIGGARMEKYGQPLLDCLSQWHQQTSETAGLDLAGTAAPGTATAEAQP